MATHVFGRLALAAALLSLGVASDAIAQSTQPSGSGTSGGAPQGSAGATGNSGASKSAASDKGGKSSLASGERKFIEKAAMDGMAEVQLGQIAQQKAQNAQVKDFGQRMVQDHGKANDELKALASSKGVQLPADTDKSHKKHAEDLQKKSADKFDKEYVELMLKEHKKDVKEFEKQAKNAKDADVRNFAAKTLPTLQEHLKMVQAMQDSLKSAPKKTAANTGHAGGSSMSGSTSSGMSASSSGGTGGTGASGSAAAKGK